ncbi:unnamed protein product [Ixodes persulcatus]
MPYFWTFRRLSTALSTVACLPNFYASELTLSFSPGSGISSPLALNSPQLIPR